MRVLSHDAFARMSLVRRNRTDNPNCAYCGMRARYQYGTERDDRPGRVEWHDKPFCCVGCFRDYTN